MKHLTNIIFALLLVMSPLTLASIENKNIDSEFNTLISLFFDAARIGNNDIITKFVTAGFPINQRNPQSYTALMVAAYQGQKETVRLLLNEGADPCLEDKRGNTAFLGALLKREVIIARDLYQADCRYEDSRNNAGLNLKEFAELFGQEKVLESFKKPTTSNK